MLRGNTECKNLLWTSLSICPAEPSLPALLPFRIRRPATRLAVDSKLKSKRLRVHTDYTELFFWVSSSLPAETRFSSTLQHQGYLRQTDKRHGSMSEIKIKRGPRQRFSWGTRWQRFDCGITDVGLELKLQPHFFSTAEYQPVQW